MCLAIHETTLSCDANGCQDVVARHHNCANVGGQKLFQYRCSCGLELVLKNDETNKIEVTFNIISSHLLGLDPAELLKMTAGNSNNTITLVSIPRE